MTAQRGASVRPRAVTAAWPAREPDPSLKPDRGARQGKNALDSKEKANLKSQQGIRSLVSSEAASRRGLCEAQALQAPVTATVQGGLSTWVCFFNL